MMQKLVASTAGLKPTEIVHLDRVNVLDWRLVVQNLMHEAKDSFSQSFSSDTLQGKSSEWRMCDSFWILEYPLLLTNQSPSLSQPIKTLSFVLWISSVHTFFVLTISPEECQMKSFGKINLLLYAIGKSFLVFVNFVFKISVKNSQVSIR